VSIEIKDLTYGGIFLSEKEAISYFKQGCPPGEIFLAYLTNQENALVSKVKINDVRERIDKHVANCEICATTKLLKNRKVM